MSIQSVAIVGVGGVGGFFGGKLCRLAATGNGVKISFLARGEHLRAIQQSGLLLCTEDDGTVVCRPTLATDDIRSLPPCELYMICVKEFDLPSVLSRLEPIAGDETILLPLLNGVDVYSRVRSVIKKGIVLPACVYVGTHIERAGKVVQKGGACKIVFGLDPLRPDFTPHAVSDLFNQSGIRSEWTPNIQVEIWKKFIFISAFGLVSAAHNKTLGEIMQDEVLTAQTRAIMLEAVKLATASGVSLPADIAEVSLLKATSFPSEAKTSFQRDFELAEKNDERDLFAGSMIRLGRELGIDVPQTSALSTILNLQKPVHRVL